HQKYYGGKDFPYYETSYINPKPNNEVDYLMIGDSYSRQYSQYMIHNNISAQTLFADACLFTNNDYVYDNKKEKKECTEFVHNFYKSLANQNISNTLPLIWAQSWDYYTLKSRHGDNTLVDNYHHTDQFNTKIVDSINDMIQKNPNRNIYLIGSYTRPNYDIYECLSTQNLSRFITESCAEFIPENPTPINVHIKKIADQYPHVYFINPDDGLCDTRGCRMLIDNEPMFSDVSHLSIYGADIVGKYIFDEIQRIENSQQSLQKQD
ncbi:SGNH hydrolase domain-containing protein, partial [Wohlfahrtiimonas populi]|uniref:SGNH hydrolase domain-containing protein n=1 Tax=Wohlfahrtiimonas populi TaxID=1940240 RepID=UPI001300E993